MAASVIIAAQANAQRKAIDFLREHHALSAEVAVEPSEAFLHNYERFKWRSSFIRLTPQGKYWLDEPEWEKLQSEKTRIAILLLIFALIALCYYFLLTSGIITAVVQAKFFLLTN